MTANRPILEADGLGYSLGREVVLNWLEEPTPVYRWLDGLRYRRANPWDGWDSGSLLQQKK